jgi:hypothetical protein
MAKKSIWELLQKRYPSNEYALMAEVSDAAGFSRSRSADYIAVGLWPSRGLAVNGIELKSFRSDWLSELKNPQKAENIFQYCDYFWLLTTDETIAKIEEIPPSWGWLCIKGEKVFVKKEAPKLTPVQLSKHFIVAMLKRACDKNKFVHIDSIEDRIKEAKERGKEENKRALEHTQKELKEYREMVSDFESKSGVRINRWNDNKKIGEAVRFIESGGTDSVIEQLKKLETTAEIVLKRIKGALESLPVSNPAQLEGSTSNA